MLESSAACVFTIIIIVNVTIEDANGVGQDWAAPIRAF